MNQRHGPVRLGLRASLAILWPYFRDNLADQIRSIWFIVAYLALFQVLVLGLPIVYAAMIGAGIAIVALGLMFFLVLGQFCVIPFIAPYMEANVGFSEQAVVWIYSIGGFATFISAPLVGRLADRFGRVIVFTIAVLLSLGPLFPGPT